MDVRRCVARDDFFALVGSPEFTRRWKLERHIASLHQGETEFAVPGICSACDAAVSFRAFFAGAWREPDGLLVPNWRETLNCPSCWLPGRGRMMVERIAAAVAEPEPVRRAFFMEQVTPLYRWAIWSHPEVAWIGSEYLGADVAPGEVRDGIRHEDAERLSLPDASQDLVVSCDVLEHVNEPVRALGEIARVLRRGGTALLSFPMDPHLDRSSRRARAARDGTIEHLLPAVYHGNPLSAEGSLVFTDFGWDVLERMREVGLRDASLDVYWSYARGYLGLQFFFTGTRG
jgi:SAM-dependent methyltransferase